MKKLKLVISDLHLSRGRWLKDGRRNPLEDFHQDDRFREFLEHYSTGSYADWDIELVINGDFFDPLAVLPTSENGKVMILNYPEEVEEEAAVSKFKTIVSGHPISMRALVAFLERGKRIVFRWGNHDAAILWPRVQELLRAELKPPQSEQLTFQKDPYLFDRICIDHGHQHEIFNQFDVRRIFIERKIKGIRKTILNLPFGSFFVFGFISRIKLEKPFITYVQPLRSYIKLSIFMNPVFFVVNGFKVSWFFFKMRFIKHPMRFSRIKKTFLLLVEALHRPSLEKVAEEIFSSPEADALGYDTLILGHNHQAMVRVFPGGKQYINTGTWTPLTSLEMSTLGHRVLRTYALIEYLDNGSTRCSLKIWNGEPRSTEDFN